MPDVNPVPLIVLNAVNGPLSRGDGTTLIPTAAGSATFYNGNQVIFQDMRGGTGFPPACLSLIDIATTRETRNVNPLGCNVLVAGGGLWAAGGGAGAPAYRDAFGATRDNWRPLAVDAPHQRILVSVFNGGASTLSWWDGTTEASLAGYSGMPVQQGSTDAGLALIAVPGSGLPLTFPPQSWPQFPLINFTLRDGWVVGWSPIYNGPALWPVGSSPLGYLLDRNVDRFALSLAVDVHGHVWVVASSGAGQLPGELITYDVDPTRGTVNGVPATPVDLTHVPTPPPAFRMPVCASVFRPLAISLVGEDQIPGHAQSPQIIAPGFTSQVVVGVGCTLDKDPAWYIRDSWTLAAAQRTYWYPLWDQPTPFNFAGLPAYTALARTVVTVECYRLVGESLEAARLRWTRIITLARQQAPLVAVKAQGYRGAYGSGQFAFTEQDLADGWEILHPICVAHGVRVISVFEYDRADGVRSSPTLLRAFHRWVQASPDADDFPCLPEIDTMLTIKRTRFRPATMAQFPDRLLVDLDDTVPFGPERPCLSCDDSGVVRAPKPASLACGDHECWISTPGSGVAYLDLGAYFIRADVNESA